MSNEEKKIKEKKKKETLQDLVERRFKTTEDYLEVMKEISNSIIKLKKKGGK